MILQTVAEDLVSSVASLHIGPFKALAVFQMQFVADTRAPLAHMPLLGELLVHESDGINVSALVVALIPEAKNRQYAVFACVVGKIQTIPDITQIILERSALKAVNGDIDLINARFDDLTSASCKQGAVGRNGGTVAVFVRNADEIRQKRMCQRLSHDVKI